MAGLIAGVCILRRVCGHTPLALALRCSQPVFIGCLVFFLLPVEKNDLGSAAAAGDPLIKTACPVDENVAFFGSVAPLAMRYCLFGCAVQ